MKEKTATQRLLSLLLACVLCLTCTPVAFAESAVAASMRLMKTEGTVSVSNSSGRAVPQTERMSLRSGYQLKTEEKSYAWINLDDVKMVEMDAVTEISIRKKDRKLDILVDSGNLLFKVDQHLEGDENLNIRTSTMGVGIRGTCGWVKVIDQWTSQIYILEGTVAVTVTDPVTGETKTENISAGEMAICTVYPQDRAGSKCEIVRQEFTVADIDGFVLVELTPNKPLCDKIYEESGLDLRDPSVKPAEKLKQDQEQVREKLEEIEKQLQEQEDKISVEPVWTNPVPDPVPATPNTDSSGGGGGGGSTPAPTETITLTMPQTAATVNAYLGRSSVRQVILQPGAARASDANRLEVDSPLTVPSGKILTLQATVGLTLNENQTLAVHGTMTVDGECRLYGSLVPNKSAVIKAKFFEIPDHLADWQVSETPGSDGFYSLSYSPKGTVYTVAFNANGGEVSPGELLTGMDGKLAALPTPVREGYAFSGWFTAAEGGTQVTTATVFTQNTTIYAHWTEEGIGGDYWDYNPEIKTLYISGNGPMDNFGAATDADGSTVTNAPWDKYRSEVVAIVIREGVTSIGDYAFTECPQLVTMDIPASVAGVGSYATYGSNNLADVYYGGTEGQWHEVGIADGNDPLLNANIHFTGSDGTACVTFNPNGGAVTPQYYFVGLDGKVGTLPTPVREGYTFDGWFTAADGGTQITTNTVFTQNTTVYAHWTGETSGVTWRYDEATKTLYIEGSGEMEDYASSAHMPWVQYVSEIRSVNIKNGVTSIGVYAFSNCTSLTSVTIPSSVTRIGKGAFLACSSLPNVSIPEGVTSLEKYVFMDCTSLASVNIPDSVTKIDEDAFCDCSSLASVTIPNNVTSIGNEAFIRCTSLTSVTIPSSVTSIGYHAFHSCTNLTSVTIPNSVTSIGYSAFEDCTSLTSVTIPASVTSIDGSTFSSCTSLTSVTIPVSVIRFGNFAFSSCTKLTDVYYNGTETQWNAITINTGNEPLLNANIHFQGEDSGVTWRYDAPTKTLYIEGNGPMDDYTISSNGSSAPWMSYKTQMQTLIIENGVTSLGDYAFHDCASLTGVEIPDSVVAIGEYAFSGCSNLYQISIPDSVTTINVGAFARAGLTNAYIPGSVTNLGNGLFNSCASLTNVDFGDGITSISQSMFMNCSSLTSVTIPDSVTSIDDAAFDSCSKLTSLNIPNSVTNIGSYAFKDCRNLSDIYYDGTEAQWNTITIISTGNNYLLNANIHFLGGGDVEEGDGYRYNTATKTLYIADDGPMADNITSDKRPWNAYRGEIQTVVIEKGVTNIGDSVFARCTSLTSVTIPDGVTRIAAAAFDNCSSLTSVEIPDGVTWIGERAFRGCSNMKSVTIPGSVGKIEREAFYGCSSLTSVTIPDSITSIGYGTFNGCSSLTSVTVPGSVSTIDMSTFAGCSGLTSVTILDGVGSLGMRAFEFCSNLTNVTIPDSVTRIENLAFNGCNNLTDVYYSGTQDQWNAINTGTNNTSLTTANIHYNSRARSVVSNAASGYTDVPAGAAYAEAVNYCKTNNLMTGTSDTTFSPDGTLTRAMMVTVLHRLAGKPAAASTASFTDVAAGKWYTDAIAWANSKGIVLGYNASTFGVNDPVTHEQVALIFQRYSGNPNVQTEGADSPKTPATRAEIALTLMNYAKTYQPGTLSSVSAIDVMCAPSGIALDKNGTLLVTDVFSKQLWRVENRTGTAYAGGATVPDLYGQPLGGYNDASLSSSTFKEPWAIAPFLDGWAVSDTANNAVRLVRTSGIQTLNAATKEKLTVTNLGVAFNRPTGLAADGDGNLYVSDTGSGTVRRVSPQGGVTTVAKNLSDPMGLCWKNGALYIAETGRNRIVKLEKGTVSVVAGSGTADLTDGAAKTAAFSAPQGVTAGDDGSVYVADTGNSAIRKIKGGSVTTLVVQDPQQLSGGMISPTGLLLQGNSLYICDPFTRKIAILTVA